MTDWIPAHRRLFRGPKRALPRGVRFVLLELSLEARQTQGRLDLPVGWETLDAVHDLLGGNRDEIEAALFAFMGDAIIVERTGTAHTLTIAKWDEWAGPKTGAERQRDFRDRHRVTGPALQPVTPVTPTEEKRTGENITGEEKRSAAARPGGSEAPSQDHATFVAKLRSLPKLSDLDVEDLAGLCVQRVALAGAKVEWVLQSLQEANDKSQRGEQSHVRHSRVVGFIRASKAPKQTEAPKSERTVTYTYHGKGAPPELTKATAGIGTGPKT